MRNWLIAIRHEKGASQKDVSEAAGIAQPTYCNIENGTRNPSPKTAMEIGKFLGFDWTRFFQNENDDSEKAV